MTFFKTFVVFFLLGVSPVLAQSEKVAIEEFRLSNGMQVVLIPSHRVPSVTQMLWYKVGAADDFPGRTGLAHYNEHMMFQGTPTYKAGEFSHIVSSHGGRFNAFTSEDFTAYYVSIAKEQLPLIMELEADRMLNLAPTKENFSKERQVIIEERRMSVENKPNALLAEEMKALLFRNHPYHNPVIGWFSEMEALSQEDVLAFHKQFYHPANAILVVAGDIEKPELQALAEKYYGSLPAGEQYIRHWNVEPPQRGERHTVMYHANVKQPEFVRYYLAPSVNSQHKELVLPLSLLAQMLGGSNTSLLYQELVVKQKIATNISVSYEGFSVGEDTFEISANPAEHVDLPQLEAAIDTVLAKTDFKALPASDLVRAKTLFRAENIYARDDMEQMARTVGELVSVGLPANYINEWDDGIDKVTSADLAKAGALVLNKKSSVTGYLLPEKGTK